MSLQSPREPAFLRRKDVQIRTGLARSTIYLYIQQGAFPKPMDYYAGEGVKLLGRGAWRDATCPFHPDKSPSLRVRIETGAFRCMACGARGGDVLAFHMRRHELRFIDAAKSLGAWELVP